MEVKDVKDALAEGLKPVADEVKAAKTAAESAQTEIKSVKDEVSGLKQWQVAKDEADKKNQDALDKLIENEQKRAKIITPNASKSFHEAIKEAVEEKTDDIQKFVRKEVKRVEIELKAVGTITTGNVTGSTVWGAVQRPGIIEAPKRRIHARQLLNTGTIGAGTDYYFMRQNGPGEGAPAPAAEAATKAQIDEDLVESSVKIETIAAWAKVTRRAMNNIPGFISFLQSRFPERLLRAEDEQVFYGDGVSPNLKGILTAGNFIASTSAATTLVEKIIDDLAEFEDTYERIATLIALRPKDYFSFFKNKATGSGEYDLPRNVTFADGILYISGVPVAPTTAVHAGDYVVGDWQEGAQLLTQEGMRMEFFEQDDKNVQQNLTTVRIEETVALPVFGPDYFIKGTSIVTP